MQKLRYVIWDWNGTLLNDVDACISVMNSMLAERGISPPIDKKIYQQIFGFPIVEYYRKVGLDFEQESFEFLAAVFIERYKKESQACALYPDVRTVLDFIKGRDIKQVVLSATKSDELALQMKPFSITGYFSNIIGLDNIYAVSKVEAGTSWVRDNGIDTRSVLLIGDSLHDYEVAAEIGCRCLLVADGHQDKARLSACGCETVSALSDVIRCIKKIG